MTFENGIYYSLSDFLKQKFGTKTVKLSIDAGLHARIGTTQRYRRLYILRRKRKRRFRGDRVSSIKEQIESQKELISKKWPSANI